MQPLSFQPMVTGHRHMVVAGHYLAAEAGQAMLEAGGNAIDAGVAAGIALGVLHSDQVQFSGVAPILIYSAEHDEVVSIAGLGPWPRATRLDMFVREHNGAIPVGLLRTVVPAAPDAWITALRLYGTMGFAEVAEPAIRYAREGFAMHPVMAHYIETYRDNYARWDTNAAIWLPGGKVPEVGDLFVQSELADTIQFMADEDRAARTSGRDAGLESARAAFYTGDIGARIVAYHAENGGLLTAEDMAAFRSPVERPVSVDFHGTKVFSCRPWCQGPVLLQMLSLLSGYDLNELGHNSPDYVHTVAEAMKLCLADRERFYGDPDVIEVPTETLLSQAYAAERRRQIDPRRAWPSMPPAGEIAGYGGLSFAAHADPRPSQPIPDTSYACAMDRWGNIISATPSDVSFEGPAIPGLGLCPSSRGSQSFAMEGHASAVAPGKRPRLTPNPSLAMRPGRFAMPFGAPGGDTQPAGMLQVLLNHLVFGMDIQHAIDAPRFVTHSQPNSFEPHASKPGRLTIEGRLCDRVGEEMTRRGHDVERLDDLSIFTAGVCAISADLETGRLCGGADPRRAARAIGW